MGKNLSYLQAFFLAVACLAVSGCSNQQQTGVVVGGAGGAAVGAGVGAAAAGAGSRGAGAAVGGVVGLVAGSVIGVALTQDRPANKKTAKKENNCAECCEKRSLRAHSSCQTCHCENKR